MVKFTAEKPKVLNTMALIQDVSKDEPNLVQEKKFRNEEIKDNKIPQTLIKPTQPSVNTFKDRPQSHMKKPKPHCKRNTLILEERIQVIREFERSPNYRRLSHKFNCSKSQIQNIIEHKEAVLSFYRDGSVQDETLRRRRKRIAFLDKVIFEYIKRAVFHNIVLTEDRVSQKVIDIKNAIGIVKFYPISIWLQNFKLTYKMKSFNVNELRKSINFTERKPNVLNTVALIHDVCQNEINQEQKMSMRNESSYYYQKILEEILKSTIIDVNSSNDVKLFNAQSDGESNQNFSNIEERSSLELPKINCCQEAMRHIRVMEDFAMLKSNYRAIGLIEQLRLLLKNPSNTKEFKSKNATELSEVNCYFEALHHIKLLEDFALLKDKYQAIELIEQLEQAFKNPPNIEDFTG